MNLSSADILENDMPPRVLAALLCDHTTGRNILWATEGHDKTEEITPEDVAGGIIRPRAYKDIVERRGRTRSHAEVFTPPWVCNAQNNLVDEAWLGYANAFNKPSRYHKWTCNPEPVRFPTGRTWQDYVLDRRMEVTCGEAPYLASRYDTSARQPVLIAVPERIGILDRKLRVVSENVCVRGQWLVWARNALRSVYGYEWQGDSLLIARQTLLATFNDYFRDAFADDILTIDELVEAAEIISWNLWQMDGLKGVVPASCYNIIVKEPELLSDAFKQTIHICPGCRHNDIRKHNGIYCTIRAWQPEQEGREHQCAYKEERYIDSLKL